MSNSKTFEARTIEDALLAAAKEFGSGVEVAKAQKRRRGGIFGFFAKEYYEVIAREPEERPEPTPAEHFGEILLEMAQDVSDTYEGTQAAEPAVEPAAEPAPQLIRRVRTSEPAPNTTLANRAVGLIDLREGRRIPVDPIAALDLSGNPIRERPSRLRRRLTAGSPDEGASSPLTREVDGPLIDLRETAPEWSIERLRSLGLGERMLALVAAYEPSSDLEWVQALSTAIQVHMPADRSSAHRYLVGEGRASAIGLLQALEAGKIPAFLFIDGQKIDATPDELALSVRECIR